MYARHMVKDAIAFAFRKFFHFWITLIPRMVITFLVTAALSSATVFGLYYLAHMLKLIPTGWLELSLVITVIFALTIPSALTSIVWLRVALNTAFNKPTPIWVRPLIRPAIKIAIATIIGTICILIGTVFLILPGIFIALRLCMSSFCIIDHEHGPIKSLKCSWALTRDAKNDIWKLALIILIIALIILGILRWMGMPLVHSPVIKTMEALKKVAGEQFENWPQIAYRIGAAALSSLFVLFIAYLYAKFSRTES